MLRSNIFPLNSLTEDPNLRGDFPLVSQMEDYSVTLVAGELAIDDIVSPIALADVLGCYVISHTGDIKGDVTGVKVPEVGASGAGYLKITLVSSLATSTAAKAGVLVIVGRMAPTVVT
jgi:hypothetical protein